MRRRPAAPSAPRWKGQSCPLSEEPVVRKSVLWAPWRLEYILSPKEPDCIFCVKPSQSDDAANLILARGKHAFAILNRFPYNNGHLMVVPYRHVATLSDLRPAELTEMMLITQAAERVLTESMSAEALNIGMNVGVVAGAGIDEHLHLHVVPRWNGDTNFMPVLSDTKVVPQSLEDAYRQLQGPLAEAIRDLTTND